MRGLFSEQSEKTFSQTFALVFYLHYEAPEEEQNFAMVMEMLRAAEIEDEDSNVPSPLDNLFNDLEFENPRPPKSLCKSE
ncbi:hypothetical protein ACTQ3L_10965 [Oscillospiraceae bacterium LCP25S3_E4]